MRLIDCELETRIQVYAKNIGGTLHMVFGPDADTILINAIVLAKRHSSKDVFVGFATNLIADAGSSQSVSSKWWYAGITHGLWANGNCECIADETPTLRQIECPKDGPCRQCQRKNDWGSKNCWLCGVSEPTNLSKVGP